MPILKNAKTVWVNDNPWESPDGKVTIWQIKLEIDGERDTHNTMSKALATVGFEGDVEVYTNAKGKDYVRQAPKLEANPDKPRYQKSPEQEESIARAVALKAAVDNTVDDYDPLEVLEIADVFLVWLRGEKPSTEDEESPQGKVDKVFGMDGEPLPDYPGDEIE